MIPSCASRTALGSSKPRASGDDPEGNGLGESFLGKPRASGDDPVALVEDRDPES